MKIKMLLTLIALTNTNTSFAKKHESFFPKSLYSLNKEVINALPASKINEEQLLKMIDTFHGIYDQELNAMGAKLDIPNLWAEKEINAYAHREKGKNIFTIEIMGGLVRTPYLDTDSLALIMCHEMGHHLGGAPKKIIEEEEQIDRRSSNKGIFSRKPKEVKYSWSSAEGQADYYGAQKCMKKYYSYLQKNNLLTEETVLPEIENNCKLVYSNDLELTTCKKTANAGIKVAKIFKLITGKTEDSNILTPSSVETKQTVLGYPTIQCRLDTFYHGTLCDKAADIPTSPTDANAGYCTTETDGALKSRPLCWYKP